MARPVFRGIEVLVKKAAVDPAFRAELLAHRAAAAERIGLQLDPAEAMMLAATPAAQLQRVIAETEVPQEHRRAFLGQAAAAMLAAVGIVAGRPAAADEPAAAGGIRPSVLNGDLLEGGIRPTLPPAKPKTVEERVIGLIAKRTKRDEKKINRDTSLAKDLKITRGLPRLRAALEKEFQVKIPPGDFKKASTLGDAIDYLEKAIAKREADARLKEKTTPMPAAPVLPSPPIMFGGVRPG
jgi:acyl carrier protein